MTADRFIVKPQGLMNVRERKPATHHGLRCVAIVALALAAAHPAKAETLESALSRAYAANPTLNSNRAALRGVDENVAQAKSGYRPTVSGSADIGLARSE
ncbi:MAG: channel protein TolC, partial [Methylobacterium sp.]|nr:channel protein TolC [Methylobacterium sp.]